MTEIKKKCTRCGGSGNDPENWNQDPIDPSPSACEKCNGTGDDDYVDYIWDRRF